MFDIEKARKNDVSNFGLSIMKRVNANCKCRTHCSGHDFQRVGNFLFTPGHKATVGKYRCKKCGYVTIKDYVCGYYDGLQHAAQRQKKRNEKAEKYNDDYEL